MKFTDIIAEYGMQPGAPTPSGQQRTGQMAKQSQSPSQQQQPSPTTDPNAPQPQGAPDTNDAQPDLTQLQQGDKISSSDGRELEITSAHGETGDQPGDNDDVIVATDTQTGERFIMDPEQMQESRKIKITSGRHRKLAETRARYKKLKRKIREQRARDAQGTEPLLEINFNDKRVVQAALNANISCGFEAETVWTEVSDEEQDFNMPWEKLEDLIDGRERTVVLAAYQEWLINHDAFYQYQGEAEREWAGEYENDSGFISDFIREHDMESEVEEYKTMYLEDDPETYEEFSDEDWEKEFVHVERNDEFIEWLEEQARNDGVGFDEAFDKMQSEYSVDDWISEEFGTATEMTMHYDVWPVSSGQDSGLDGVGSIIQDWAEGYSDFEQVDVGEYHSGSTDTESTTQSWWRVEPDPSIEGDGAHAEIISPVYSSPQQMLDEMQSLFGLFSEHSVETNTTTGLHITMSMQGEQSRSEPNRLKMALLLGDRYLLKQFGRLHNIYTPSQLNRIEAKIKQMARESEFNPNDMAQIEQILQRAVSAEKYNSINFKNSTNQDGNHLIEFRIAGGDDYDSMANEIQGAVTRYATIMQAGYDDQAYRRDYLTAIARVMNQVTGNSGLKGIADSPLSRGVNSLAQLIGSDGTELVAALRNAYGLTENAQATSITQDKFVNFVGRTIRIMQNHPDVKIPTQFILGFRKGFQEVGLTLDEYLKIYATSAWEIGVSPEQIQGKLDVLSKLLGKNRIQLGAEHQPEVFTVDYRKFAYMAPRAWVHKLSSMTNLSKQEAEQNIVPVGRDEYNQVARAHQNMQMVSASESQKQMYQQVIDRFDNKYEIRSVIPGVATPEIPDQQAYIPVAQNDLRKAGLLVDAVTESTEFESLPLEEQLLRVSKLDEAKLAKRHKRAWQRLQEHKLVESVPEISSNTELKRILSKPLLAGDLQGQMRAFTALPVPAMIKAFRQVRGEQGDGVDLRDIVKQYIKAYKPERTQRKLSEGISKDDIIQAIKDMNPENEQHLDLLSRIYKILHSGVIGQNIDRAFETTLDGENLSKSELAQVKVDMTNIIGNLDADFAALEKFVGRMENEGGVVNIQELMKPITTLDAILGDQIALKAFFALANYGVGRKQKGPGEYALACLSNSIKLASGEGDLEIDGIGKVELKAALASSGGRIGYGGDTQKIRRDIIDQYAEHLPTVMAQIGQKGGSLGLSKFVPALNTDLPINVQENRQLRKKLVLDLLKRDMGQYANDIADKFATSEDLIDIENTYLIQNFLWYKNRDDFDALLLMHVPNRKSAMIRDENDLVNFRRSGQAEATHIRIIPTQAGAGREQWAQLTLNKQAM